ncbi:MAG TPA: tetratricopeptide repeat protein [Bryobacterales bacterium]|nr:tetratricopeptide repeat protein [Bryobacterales bacterium]
MGRRLTGLVLASGLLALGALRAAERQFDLAGHVYPEGRASITLFGATTPFTASTTSDSHGRFRFRRLAEGTYTVAVFVPGGGEARQTIEVGPSFADAKGHVALTLELRTAQLNPQALQKRHLVSARELSIPARARREYQEAQKSLSRRDAAGAVAHLEKAVAIAPQFATAWNNLGTIAYQSREFARAEQNFRKALEQDSQAFEPLVNLGGALLSEGKFPEALPYNRDAVEARPRDALANSQLGLNYFALGDFDRAEKYLITAQQIDPAHFSEPQLTLAEIYIRENKPRAAALELEDFLRRHPDATNAAEIRKTIEKLKK